MNKKEDLIIEIWIPIKGYEYDYEVSSLGRVKSKDRTVPIGESFTFKKGRVLKPEIIKKGYERVGLSKNGTMKKKQVHRLVLENFNPTDDDSLQVNHIDGNKRNNKLENLEWVTAKENNQHARRTGLLTHNGRGRHKLSDEEVREIRKMNESGLYTKKSIADKFGVCKDTITGITLGRTYKFVE